MPDVLVLGADGFIGSHVCRALIERGLSVRAFDRIGPTGPRRLQRSEDIEIVTGDFLDARDLANAVRGARHVIHLISSTTPASSGTDPAWDIESNVIGTIRLLELCVEAGIERVHFASTGGAIYGHALERPLREDDLAVPISPYAIGKLAIEGLLRHFQHAHQLRSVAFRISNPYGPGQALEGTQGAIPIFLRHLLRDEPITVFGDGSMERDYLYIADLADAIARTVDVDTRYDVYNIASGQLRSVRELLAELARSTGIAPIVRYEQMRATDVQRVCLDTTRFETEFGPISTTTLKDGLERTVAYVHDQLEACADDPTGPTTGLRPGGGSK